MYDPLRVSSFGHFQWINLDFNIIEKLTIYKEQLFTPNLYCRSDIVPPYSPDDYETAVLGCFSLIEPVRYNLYD